MPLKNLSISNFEVERLTPFLGFVLCFVAGRIGKISESETVRASFLKKFSVDKLWIRAQSFPQADPGCRFWPFLVPNGSPNG